ncbi:hypothetical protein JX266_010812 [Neoarthrinium moseri]|nr:hypothetical protein JX266_010812 [Neoarthrinium moseri]
MMFRQLLASVLLAASVHFEHAAGAPYPQSDIDSGKVLANLSQTAYNNAMSRLAISTGTCTKENVKVRKEWRKLPAEDRIAYRKAVECLMQQPPAFTNVSGAKTAFDDFGVLHVAFTPYVHASASFLTFHRYYIHTFEQRLRNLCGFKGTMPYWEWGLDCADMDKSPLFDGSDTSLGGNGEKVRGGQSPGGMFGAKAGTGGGCVKKGPFSNYTVNMGPIGARNPLDYNPRCLKRDLNSDICARWASIRNTTQVITDTSDIELFQAMLQGDPRYAKSAVLGLAVHGGGHFTIGGDPGGDFYFSPLEPGFYLHHGQIDRMYFVWQNLDWAKRQNVAGTITMNNQPPSRNGTLDDTLDFSPLNPEKKLRDLMDTIAGPFCYVYE